jgi:histidinol-phosphatase (PHP family)
VNYFNYHTHTFYCDGKATPEEFIKEAIRSEMTAIGFSSHSPLPFNNEYSIKTEKVVDFKNEIRSLQEKYKDNIRIFLALEFDYVPEMSDNFSILKEGLSLDYSIGSVHLVKNRQTGVLWFIDGPEVNYIHGVSHVFQNNIRLAVESYFEQVNEMITTQKPDIVGHIDKIKMHNKGRYFSEEEGWYKDLLTKTLETARKNGSIIELNTRGVYKKRCDSFYPGTFALTQMHKMNIPVTLSSDAHKPDELTSCFPEAIALLKETGYKEIKYFSGSSWEDQPI